MIRNLKVLLAAAMALAAFGIVNAAGAQAAEFHCSAEPCRYTAKQDGTGKTAHQVFIVKGGTESVSFTCETISGEGSSATKTASSVTVENIAYGSCTVNGSPGVTVVMNGCKYQFSASGSVTVTGCASGKKIEVKIGEACTFTIGEQGPLSTIKYHTIGTTPNREVTVETAVTGISTTADGTQANCKINPNQTLTGEYTTGNAIVTGETSAGVMADAWFE